MSDGGTDAAPSRPAAARARTWWLVAGALIAAFLARAPLYLSVFPPFEGWDEYQHLAYIAHVDETGTMPVFEESLVPSSLQPLVASVPHSQWGSEQVQTWGALPYPEFWKSGASAAAGERGEPPPIRLYQAQHPPLAYFIAAPIWGAVKTTRPLDGIYAIRAMNLLLVAAALVLFAAALPRMVPAFGPRVAALALVCLHPLFFQNIARVANDAFSLAAGVAGISLLLLADRQTLVVRGMLAAACIAASVWGKQTGLTLMPALVLGLPLIGWLGGAPRRRVWLAAVLSTGLLLLLVSPLWLWSYEQYGALVTTQESLELAERGPLLDALVTSARTHNWRSFIRTVFVPGTVWVGGWSFLRVDGTLGSLYGWSWGGLLAAAALGAIVAMRRRVIGAAASTGAGSAAPGTLAVCAAVVVVTALGMIHHALVSNSLLGRSTTNPWYFMTALPFLFVLVVRGLEALDRRLATLAPAMLAVLFVAIDLHGTWVQMPQAYADTTDAALQWSRLSAIHPAILSGDLRWLFLALQLGALALVAAALVRARARAATPA